MSDPLDPPEATEEWFRSAKLSVYRDAAYYGYGFAKAGKYVPIEEVFVAKPIPTYVCHKRVQALEIRAIGNYSTDADSKLRREIVFADPAFRPIYVPGDMFVRYVPVPGDYYVVYEDGYASFSPRGAFLEGYALALPDGSLLQRLNDARAVYSGTPEPLKALLTEAYVEILRLRADATITRQMAGFKEVKREQKTDPDQA